MRLKEAKAEKRGKFNFITSIWIVPIIAIIIALWLVYEHFSRLGPLIKIDFKESGGLVAGQSVVKFRDVPVGKVEKIEINNEKDGVIVHARINNDAKAFLNETTKFWIVKPEVSYSGVQGLDTILSGTYIKMYAKKGKEFKKEFIGLDRPYVDTSDAVFYNLISTFPAKVKQGTPIYFKGYQVGEVDNVKLDLDSKNLKIKLKIFKKYEDLVNETTKFWVQSLVNLKLKDNKLDVDVAPLSTILLGGIEFSTKFDKRFTKTPKKEYRLYISELEAKRNSLRYIRPIYERVMFNFNGDVSSIDIGMEIKYKGIKLGEINKIDITYDSKNKSFKALCIGEVDISNFGSNKDESVKNFFDLMASGLIAKLEKTLLFNKSNIILKDSNKRLKVVFNDKFGAYEIATKPLKESGLMSKIDAIVDNLNETVKKFKKLDFSKSVAELNRLLIDLRRVTKDTRAVLHSTNKLIKHADKSLKGADRAIVSADKTLKSATRALNSANVTLRTLNKSIKDANIKRLSNSLNQALVELRRTLRATRKTLKGYGKNSLFMDKLDATLRELHNATTQTTRLINKLNKKPNSLIFGD
jgi:paraquat-inducible protein B